jgi:tetratricopeptide (TPR) repeat protein/cellulose biosynthesis protein BcsQ
MIQEVGEVITFYSYKGGTGRSMALANTGCILAKRIGSTGKILLIDWDLEAPGLHRFFGPFFKVADEEVQSRPGLIELFGEIDSLTLKCVEHDQEMRVRELFKFEKLQRYMLPTTIENLFIVKAGCFDQRYGERVNRFKWDALFNRCPWIFSLLSEQLANEFRYVLIDSRTGITDTSGICTMIMPEKLVCVFTPNNQSLTGVVGLINQIPEYRQELDDLRPLSIFPLPSRVEGSELDLRNDWRFGKPSKHIEGYQPIFERVLDAALTFPEGASLGSYFDAVQIPHLSRYAYGEDIAVLTEQDKGTLSLSSKYESFVERIVNCDYPWEEPSLLAYKDISSDLIKRAESYQFQGRYDDSKILYERAIEARRKGAGGADLELSKLLTNLGSVNLSIGNTAHARLLFHESLDIQHRIDRNHPDVGASMLGLARCALIEGKISEALERAGVAVEMQERVLGLDHPDVAAGLCVLGSIMIASGDRERGLRNLQKSLSIRTSVLGADHPAVAESLTALAKAQRNIESLAGFKNALRIRRAALGELHPETAETYYEIGELFREIELHKTSCEFYEQAMLSQNLSHQLRDNIASRLAGDQSIIIRHKNKIQNSRITLVYDVNDSSRRARFVDFILDLNEFLNLQLSIEEIKPSALELERPHTNSRNFVVLLCDPLTLDSVTDLDIIDVILGRSIDWPDDSNQSYRNIETTAFELFGKIAELPEHLKILSLGIEELRTEKAGETPVPLASGVELLTERRGDPLMLSVIPIFVICSSTFIFAIFGNSEIGGLQYSSIVVWCFSAGMFSGLYISFRILVELRKRLDDLWSPAGIGLVTTLSILLIAMSYMAILGLRATPLIFGLKGAMQQPSLQAEDSESIRKRFLKLGFDPITTEKLMQSLSEEKGGAPSEEDIKAAFQKAFKQLDSNQKSGK